MLSSISLTSTAEKRRQRGVRQKRKPSLPFDNWDGYLVVYGDRGRGDKKEKFNWGWKSQACLPSEWYFLILEIILSRLSVRG
ncbi:MAG: hypothetical protein NZ901_09465 [Geminocystis sp.]|nr:hypothetical protein [Geminocystis sp.]HIK38874.1 hypothetical protein [Geminocystis sp. M7585_C2015_104]MCS7148403.1 hypothetical protein [Geminocystis sp.]MCX8078282.1 hypothetical protein [Geminocystis sp.]MDW8116009.1 hypothetical protein [Geminocystis sp.]